MKLLWIVLCTTGAVLFTEPWWMLGLSLFSLVGALLLGADLLSLARRLVKFLPVLAFIVVVQVFFGRGGSPLVAVQGRVLITAEGLQRGAAAALRFFVILCSGAVMMGEDSRRVINSLSQLGVPYVLFQHGYACLPLARRSVSSHSPALRGGSKGSLGGRSWIVQCAYPAGAQ